MEEAGPWGLSQLLLWLGLLLCISGLQAGGKEEQKCLLEGKNLTMTCPYSIRLYSLSLKAWQWVRSLGSPETLVLTNSRNTDFSFAQAGRYLLEDYPTEAVVKVTVIGLQRQDGGLYQCVVFLSPDNLVVLHDRIRLVQCQDQLVMVIVLTCGFILNKGLVFSVLFVFLCKAGPKVSQPSKMSEVQGVSEK
ncbi:triggering receptor expressed on myeloid cells 3-like [Meriones unguiculatus]|uniref:triggering receptor expressed on myeloid cells 3-like n=1 Tax=Meriones unguiculatus TaxID=10047 RepID=UPI00293E66C8|nr:triggering receptor expressed on myeloid cells 3-like [Meriones unguiculatus]